MPRSGDLLDGRYRLGAPLGSGGSATVYSAVDTRLGRPVAVKTGASCVHREAVLLGKLAHPGLVTVHDAGSNGDVDYLVMEQVPGRPLSDLLVDGPLPAERAMALVEELAVALAFVHGHGIVHGDVKPGNVLVDRHGHCKLADFGIARAHQERDLERRGTPLYASPEQLAGEEATSASDVYSLGLVLLTTLTARPPFPAADPHAALRRGRARPVLPVGLPGRLQELLQQMTDPEPSARPSAATAAVALRRRPAAPTTAALDSPTQGLPRQRVVLLPALLVALAFVLLIGLTSGPSAAPPENPLPRATPSAAERQATRPTPSPIARAPAPVKATAQPVAGPDETADSNRGQGQDKRGKAKGHDRR